ncbi:MAG: DUF4157 domain-containing protein [Bacteroidota bacterium]
MAKFPKIRRIRRKKSKATDLMGFQEEQGHVEQEDKILEDVEKNDENALVGKSQQFTTASRGPVQKKENKTGIPDGVKNKMEKAFESDFSDVKIFPNSKKAFDFGAEAYAQNNQIHFSPGKFNPNTQKGQELIGHELAHINQQNEGKVKATSVINSTPFNDQNLLEKEAELSGKKATVTGAGGIGSKKKQKAKRNNSKVQPVQANNFQLTDDEVTDLSMYQDDLQSSQFVLSPFKSEVGEIKKTLQDIINKRAFTPLHYDAIEKIDTKINTGEESGSRQKKKKKYDTLDNILKLLTKVRSRDGLTPAPNPGAGDVRNPVTPPHHAIATATTTTTTSRPASARTGGFGMIMHPSPQTTIPTQTNDEEDLSDTAVGLPYMSPPSASFGRLGNTSRPPSARTTPQPQPQRQQTVATHLPDEGNSSNTDLAVFGPTATSSLVQHRPSSRQSQHAESPQRQPDEPTEGVTAPTGTQSQPSSSAAREQARELPERPGSALKGYDVVKNIEGKSLEGDDLGTFINVVREGYYRVSGQFESYQEKLRKVGSTFTAKQLDEEKKNLKNIILDKIRVNQRGLKLVAGSKSSLRSEVIEKINENLVGYRSMYQELAGISGRPGQTNVTGNKPEAELKKDIEAQDSSWFKLRGALAYKDNGEDMDEYLKYRLAVMERYAQATVDKVGADMKGKVKTDVSIANKLNDVHKDIYYAAGGSETPTSDIDLTFAVPEYPEFEIEAVKTFNEKFRSDFNVTSGRFFDLNAYSSGFLPSGQTKGALDSPSKLGLGSMGMKTKDLIKQGKLDDAAINAIKDAKHEKHQTQIALSYVSILQFYYQKSGMSLDQFNSTYPEWGDFEKESKQNFLNYFQSQAGLEQFAQAGHTDLEQIFVKAKKIFKDTQEQIEQKIKDTELPEHLGIAGGDKSKEHELNEHKKGLAKDVLYEDKLTEVQIELKNINDLTKEIFNLQEANQNISAKIKERAERVQEFERLQGEALIYSNEAYFSSGPVFHVVKGMQGGGEMKVGTQKKIQSLLMNIGYKLQHFKENYEERNDEGGAKASLASAKYSQRIHNIIGDAKENSPEKDIQDQLGKSNVVGDQGIMGFLKNEIEIVEKIKKGKDPETGERIKNEPAPQEAVNELKGAGDKFDNNKDPEKNTAVALEIAKNILGPYYKEQYDKYVKENNEAPKEENGGMIKNMGW